jgi:hypothetical protein
MAADPNVVEQAVSRTLRDNLEKIQRTAEELHQSINDLVSACASSRPSNALPPMIRVQTSAASLAATLEVLSRLVTSALQPPTYPPFEAETQHAPSMNPPMPVTAFEQPEPVPAHPTQGNSWTAPMPAVEPPAESPVETPAEPPVETPFESQSLSGAEVAANSEFPPVESPVETPAGPPVETPFESQSLSEAEVAANSEFPPAVEMPPMAEFTPAMEPIFPSEPVQVFVSESAPEAEIFAPDGKSPESEPVEADRIFSLDSLPLEEQELHRRAYRVAKVSMQDIKMLRSEDVRIGRENRDLCIRLRDDIEKAHKEYDRRFQSIQSHPVDYFYDWMVEILGGGDAQALGEYPYPSHALHR